MQNQLAQRLGAARGELADALSLGNERLFLTMVLLSVVPLWIGPYMPLVDLPQHAAQITALRELAAGDPSFLERFRINWFTPYLLGDLLLYPLTWIMPITVATKLVVSIAVAAVPILTGRLLRVAGAYEGWKWLAIPCSFSYGFYWGFLPYVLTVPLALLFISHSIQFVAAPTPRRAAGIALFSVALFFCHVIALGLAALVSLGHVLGAHYRDWKTLVLRALPYTAPLPLIAAWMASNYGSDPRIMNGHASLITFGPVSYRLQQLLSQPAGHEDMSSWALTALVTLVVFLLPWYGGGRFSRDPKRWLPFALALLVFLLGPHYVLDTAYFYQRLGVFLVPLWLMTWDPPCVRRRFDWVAMGVVVVWVAAMSSRFASFARETESFRNVMAAMEPGRNAAAMIVEKYTEKFGLPVYLHFGAWYQATTGGIVDFNFADFYSQLVLYRLDAGPRVTEDVQWIPYRFHWDIHGGNRYDYFLVKSGADVSSSIFKERRESVELVARSGWWWLYRNLARPEAKASTELASVPNDVEALRH